MRRLLAASTVILSGALYFGVPIAAHATTINLTDTWSEGTISHLSGSANNEPTLSTSSQSTSNAGPVTPVGNPHTTTLTVGATSATSEWLFVAVPGSHSGAISADIAVNFTLNDGLGGTANFTAYMDYYANLSSDTDDMAWFAAPTTPGFLNTSPTLTDNVTLSDGTVIAVTLAYETDWDMAQAITYKAIDGPTVPEPASIALLGVGLLGTVAFTRRRRA